MASDLLRAALDMRSEAPLVVVLLSACGRMPAPGAPQLVVHAEPFLENGFFSFGASAAFSADAECPRIVVTNGYDWVPQYPVVIPLERGATCEAPGRTAWRTISTLPVAYWTDVLSVDLDGDGTDEVVIAALADDTHLLGSGFIDVLSKRSDGGWNARRIADGVSPTKLEAADVDGDGALDIIAAVPIAGGATRDVTQMGRFPSDGASLVLFGGGGGYHRVDLPRVRGAYDLRAADVDQDGTIDLVFAGVRLEWLSGAESFTSRASLAARLDRPPHEIAEASVLFKHVRSAVDANGQLFLAAADSCWTTCDLAPSSGVRVWRMDGGAPVEIGSFPTFGLAGALYLGKVGPKDGVSLFFGGLTRCADARCAEEAVDCLPGMGCLGGRWQVVRHLSDDRRRTIDVRLEKDGVEFHPMAHDIAAIGDPSSAHAVALPAIVVRRPIGHYALPPDRMWLSVQVEAFLPDGLGRRRIGASLVRDRGIVYFDRLLPKGASVFITGNATEDRDWFVASGSPLGFDRSGQSLFIDALVDE